MSNNKETKKNYDFEFTNFEQILAKIKTEYEKQKCKEQGITLPEFTTTSLAMLRNKLYAGERFKDIKFDGYELEEKKKPKINRLTLKIDNYTQNVEEFYDTQPFFYDKSGIFWFWKSNRYEQVDDTDVMSMLDDTLGFMGQTVNSRIKSHYMEAFKRVGRKKIPTDAPSKWVQFKDIAFSIESNKIYKVEPNYFFTNPIPWEIGKSEDTPTIDKLVIEWVGEKYKKTLYELIAYCCYIDYPIQLLFCLVGSGRNGKGCFLKVLDKFIGGDDNVTSTSLDLISGTNKSRFESFRLYKKLVALMGETNFGLLTNTSLLKQLTGGDKIGFEKKGKDPFTAYNYAKIIIASNSLPTTQDTSDGFFRRWLIIDFSNEFPEGKDITKNIPKIEYNNLAKKVVGILPKLLETGYFTNQGEIKERRMKYILASNPLPLFIKRCCDVDDSAFVSYNELYTAYIQLLKTLKKRRVSRKEFKIALEDEGYWIEKTSHNIDGEWKNNLNIEGLRINLENLEFFDNNPTLFSIKGGKVGKVSKFSKFSKNQSVVNKTEPIFDTIYSDCTTCGTKISHIYDEKTGNPYCETCYKAKEANK